MSKINGFANTSYICLIISFRSDLIICSESKRNAKMCLHFILLKYCTFPIEFMWLYKYLLSLALCRGMFACRCSIRRCRRHYNMNKAKHTIGLQWFSLTIPSQIEIVQSGIVGEPTHTHTHRVIKPSLHFNGKILLSTNSIQNWRREFDWYKIRYRTPKNQFDKTTVTILMFASEL